MAGKKTIIGSLLLTLLAGSILFVTLSGSNVQIKFDKYQTTFFVKEADKWVSSGVETDILYDASGKTIKPSGSTIKWFLKQDGIYIPINNSPSSLPASEILVERTISYKNSNVTIKDSYYFDGRLTDVTQFPVKKEVTIAGLEKGFYTYQVKNLEYSGPTKTFTEQTSFDFGKNMKIIVDPNYLNGKIVSNKKATFTVKYPVNGLTTYSVRLFDPPTEIFNFTMNSGNSNNSRTNGTGSIVPYANVTGAVFVSTEGGYYQFDGSGDSIKTGHTTTYNTTGWGISLWARSNNTGTCSGTQDIFVKGWNYRIFIYDTSCNLAFITGNASGPDVSYFSTKAMTANTWRHIVYTYNASSNTTYIYVDGTLITSKSQPGIETDTDQYSIGGGGNSGTSFNGSIDRVVFFNSTLGLSDVLNLYASNHDDGGFQTNLTISFNTNKGIVNDWFHGTNTHGIHCAPGSLLDTNGDGTTDANANYTWACARIQELGTVMRGDSYTEYATNSVTDAFWSPPTSNVHIGLRINLTQNLPSNHLLYMFTILLTPPQVQNKTSDCVSDNYTCMFNDSTRFGKIQVAFIGNITASNASLLPYIKGEIGNEPDLYIFFLRNVGATNTTRYTLFNQYYNQTYDAIKAVYPTIKLGGPGICSIDTDCTAGGGAMLASFVGNLSSKLDFISWHSYRATSNPLNFYDELVNESDTVANLCVRFNVTGGSECVQYLTEWNHNGDSFITDDAGGYPTQIALGYMAMLNNRANHSGLYMYEFAETEPFIYADEYPTRRAQVAYPQLDNALYTSYYVQKNFFTYFPNGTQMYGSNTTDTDVRASIGRHPNGTYYLMVVNSEAIPRNITVLMDWSNFTNATLVNTSTVFNISSTTLNLGSFPGYTIRTYYLGVNSTVVTIPSYWYQEFANVSDANGSLSTGSYNCVEDSGGFGPAYCYMNYSTPSNVTSAIWQTKFGVNITNPGSGQPDTLNNTIPQACFNAYPGKIQLRGYMYSGLNTGTSYGQCYNGTAWETFTKTSSCSASSVGPSGTLSTGNYTALFDGSYASPALFYYVNGPGTWRYISPSGSFFPDCDGSDPIAGYAGLWYEEGVWWINYPIPYNLVNTTTTLDATITFNSSQSSNVSISYGLTTSLGTTYTDTTFSTNHTYILSNLLHGNTYYYNITLCNSGNTCNSSGPYSFTMETDLTLLDKSGNNFTLVRTSSSANNPTYNSSGFYRWDGINDILVGNSTSSVLNKNTTWTLAAWVNPIAINSSQTGNRIVVAHRLSDGVTESTAAALELGSSNKANYHVRNTTAVDIVKQPYTISSTNTWYHFAVTYNGSQYKFYVNGVLNDTYNDSFYGFGTNNMRIGAFSLAGGDSFNGYIDDIRIYNSSLTSTQITTIVSNRTTDCSNLRAWYTFSNSTSETCNIRTFYQEFANVSDSNGSIGTGSYAVTSSGAPGIGYLYINYTKPVNAVNLGYWQVKHGGYATYNISIPDTCWNQSNTLQLAIQSQFSTYQGSQPLCYNGTAFEYIGTNQPETGGDSGTVTNNEANMYDGDYNTYSCWRIFSAWGTCISTNDKHIYEEGMWWTVPTDSSSPVISGVSASVVSNNASIIFTTDDVTNSSINYGTTTALGTLLANSSLSTTHNETITGLSFSTTYYYNITACNPDGLCTTTGPNSFSVASISRTLCSGISSVIFLADVRYYNFSTGTITQYNVTPWNQTTCLFNITLTTPNTYTASVYTNTTTTSKQRIYCGLTYGTKTEINTTPVVITTTSSNSTISCWQDMVGVSSSAFKDINVSLSVI